MPSIENEYDYLAKGQRYVLQGLFRGWDAVGARLSGIGRSARNLPGTKLAKPI